MKKRLTLSLIVGVFALLISVFASKPNEVQVKADYTPYQVLNGGFETGDLTGWKSYRLWKDEEGMAAFHPSLVHGHATYFGSHPYDRDGNYQLGVSSGQYAGDGPIKWDGSMSEERMGYLRSSDFILGGTGWISFKLGGGKHPSFAYLSVRKSTDHTEVARFANRHYNDKNVATAQYGSNIDNAEAFLFQYYFDLSAHLNEKLYFLLCDTSSLEWSVLSADSFVTYYSETLSPSADQTALNILPEVKNIASADNSIKNGSFNPDLTDWSTSDVQGDKDMGWDRDGEDSSARSNKRGKGDNGVGILRSSAFTLGDNNYVKFDWAGGLKHDKQIFVSVKEVGTNIEKLRFVRRDNLSNKENENFDNHFLDLTSLNTSKKYYLEFADNRAGGWGVSYVKNVQLVNYNTPEGDRAVSISHLPTSFDIDPLQEATNYGAYFLAETYDLCLAGTGNLVPWNTLSAEYATLSNAAKDIFVDDATTDANVVAARERAVYLFNKYGEAQGWTFFIVDSANNAYPRSAPVRPIDTLKVLELSPIYLLIFAAVGTGTAYLYLVMRRKRTITK